MKWIPEEGDVKFTKCDLCEVELCLDCLNGPHEGRTCEEEKERIALEQRTNENEQAF